MKQPIIMALCLGLMGACGDGNPFFVDPADEAGDADPTAGTSSVYGTSLNDALTMNALDYDDQGTPDPADDILLVNNLPFDNSDASGGGYTRIGALSTSPFDLYESPTSGGPGDRKYFAVFQRTTYAQVAAVATDDYVDFGFGGASAQRVGPSGTPASRAALYTFTGDYAAVAVVRPDAGGGTLRYITGDATVFVDLEDFDTNAAVEGIIDNRQYFDDTGAPLGPLSGYIELGIASIDFENDLTLASTATSVDAAVTIGTGQWSSVFAGPNGEQIAGIVVIEGTMPVTEDPERETGVFIVTNTE
ncbi:MAG: hypothetical protein QNL92_07670 [Octadecabacter sp.]